MPSQLTMSRSHLPADTDLPVGSDNSHILVVDNGGDSQLAFPKGDSQLAFPKGGWKSLCHLWKLARQRTVCWNSNYRFWKVRKEPMVMGRVPWKLPFPAFGNLGKVKESQHLICEVNQHSNLH